MSARTPPMSSSEKIQCVIDVVFTGAQSRVPSAQDSLQVAPLTGTGTGALELLWASFAWTLFARGPGPSTRYPSVCLSLRVEPCMHRDANRHHLSRAPVPSRPPARLSAAWRTGSPSPAAAREGAHADCVGPRAATAGRAPRRAAHARGDLVRGPPPGVHGRPPPRPRRRPVPGGFRLFVFSAAPFLSGD